MSCVDVITDRKQTDVISLGGNEVRTFVVSADCVLTSFFSYVFADRFVFIDQELK